MKEKTINADNSVVKVIINYIDERRKQEGVNSYESFNNLFDALSQQMKSGGIGNDHPLIEILKEIIFLTPDEKYMILKKVFEHIMAEYHDYFVYDTELQLLIQDIINPIKNKKEILINSPISGLALSKFLKEEFKDSNITYNQYLDEAIFNIEKKINDLFDIGIKISNVHLNNFDSLNQKFDVVFNIPPYGRVGSEDYDDTLPFTAQLMKSDTVFSIEEITKIVNEHGYIISLMSDELLFLNGYKPFRKYILDNMKILAIVDLPEICDLVNLNEALLILRKDDISINNLLMASLKNNKIENVRNELNEKWTQLIKEEIKDEQN